MLPCGWLNFRRATEAWLSVSLMGMFGHRQPEEKQYCTSMDFLMWVYEMSIPSKGEERLVLRHDFSEERQLIKKTVIKILGRSVKINNCKSSDSWAFQRAEVLCVGIKPNWSSPGRLFDRILNVWLTTLRKNDTEWAKPENSYVKYQQQEQC